MGDRDRSESDQDQRSEHAKDQRGRDESKAERLDRNYDELLQELRVLQAGVQILFAFLLTIVFQQRFGSVSDFQRNVYLVSLINASLATVCITAPVAFHRIVFRRGMKDELIVAANRFAAAGMTFFALAMVGAVFLVIDYLLNLGIAVVVSGGLAAVFVVLWVVLPLVARARQIDDEQDPP
jgi:predicted neutral ceramidase superfamily lipid hydrolase